MALELGNPIVPPPPPPKIPSKSPGTSSAGVKAAEKAREARVEDRAAGLAGLGQLACIPLLATGNLADMGAVTTHAPTIAHEAAELAETNERVASVIDRVIAIGPFAGLVAATVPLILQILVNHNRLPSNGLSQFGVYPRELMEQRAALEAMKAQAQLMREQAEAQAELQEIQEQINEAARANGSKAPEA